MDKSVNPFDLLPDGDEGSEDLSVLVAKVSVARKVTHPSSSLVKDKTQNSAPAQLPSKPLSPAEYVRNDRGTGRGGRGDTRNGYQRNYHRNSITNGGNADSQVRDGHGGGSGRGDSVSNGGNNADNDVWQVAGGRGNEYRRENRNYGDKERRDQQINAKRENRNAPEQGKTPKKEEIKEMTLAEYEKVKLEKRKALDAVKCEGRKVALDKDMQILEKKKRGRAFYQAGGLIYICCIICWVLYLYISHSCGFFLQKSEKDKLNKKKSFEKEEKGNKSMTLNAFLKPVEHEKKPTEDEKKANEHEKHIKSTGNGAAWGGNRGYAHDGGRGGRGGHIGLHKEGSSEQPNNKENKHAPPPSGFEVQFPVLGREDKAVKTGY